MCVHVVNTAGKSDTSPVSRDTPPTSYDVSMKKARARACLIPPLHTGWMDE